MTTRLNEEDMMLLWRAGKNIERLNAQRIGSIVKVLVENLSNGIAVGRSYAEAPEVDGKIIEHWR